MKYGIREIANVVFKAKNSMQIGSKTFAKGQPVLYIDTAKTSTIEGAATTVYATGGPGNTRLVTWEGEKTLTFTVEDALLSPIGFSILSGAGLFKGTGEEEVHVHSTALAVTNAEDGSIDLTDSLETDEKIDGTAPVFIAVAEADGSVTGELITGATVDEGGKKITVEGATHKGATVFVDFYVTKKSANVSELQIDAENFAGNYYVEASTLFRDTNGTDYPVEITFPNVKIQSNFTFQMAPTGDPSTFTFTMDAMPGYTMFDPTNKVLCVMQIIEDVEKKNAAKKSVMGHTTAEKIEEAGEDSTEIGGEAE